MTFVLLTFNDEFQERFENLAGASPSVQNFDCVIDPVEKFKGSASLRVDNSYITLSADARFRFGKDQVLFHKYRFFAVDNRLLGLVGSRQNENNLWYIQVDLSTPGSQKVILKVRQASQDFHDISVTLSEDVALGKWHTLEVAHNGNVLRIWLDGALLSTSTSSVDATVGVSASAPVVLGRTVTGADASPETVYFSRFIDEVVFSETLPDGYDTDTDHVVQTWTGNVNKLLSLDIEARPAILNNTHPQNIPDFETQLDQLFIAGINPMRKVDDSTVYDIGMDPPTYTIAPSGVGTNYDFVLTWRDARGNESPASAVSLPAGNAINSEIDISGATVPTQAVEWVVYRRYVGAGQAFHYRIKILPVATKQWTVDVAEGAQSISIIAPLQGSIRAPISNYIVYNKARMFYGYPKIDGEEFPTRVYYSDLNQLEIVGGNNWFYVGDNDAEKLTGLARYRGSIVIFKERSTYIAVGDPQDPAFDVIDLSLSVGCVAHTSVVEADGKLLWVGDEGVYLFDNREPDPMLISNNVEELFESIPIERKPYIKSVVDHERGLVLISMSHQSRTHNDLTLCYNYRDSLEDGNHRWSIWNCPIECSAQGSIGTGRKQRVFFVDDEGRVGMFEGSLDFGEGLNWSWKTGNFNPFDIGRRGFLRYLTLLVDHGGFNPMRFTIGAETLNAEISRLYSLMPKDQRIKINTGLRGETMSIFARGEDVRESLTVTGFQLDGEGLGYR